VEFLSAGTRTAMLVTSRPMGGPLVAPVWLIVDNGELVFNTGRESAKGLALAIHVSSFASTTRIRPTRS
jgi:Pyridoxamine 5'-phosphate oxidase